MRLAYCDALQFLKLGAGSSIPGLSEYYIIWDLDMILHRQLHVLQRGAQGGLQTLVNFGGADVDGYKSSYRNLFHQGCVGACTFGGYLISLSQCHSA
jgi:hypothetical protein